MSPGRFKPYPTYKDSGVEWLGEIPAHWEVKRLKFIAPARINKMNTKPEEAVYVGLEHVESWTGKLLLDNQPESVDSVVASFRAGDVLFGKLRPYLAKAARPHFDGVCTSEIIPLRPAPECSQSYVMYCLLNAPYIRWLDSLTYGTKMPRVSPEQVGSSFAPVPPGREQGTIAAFLDGETARIDALVAKKERLIELLQEKRTALITRAVTKGLDPSVPMKDSGVDWLGEIPVHWAVVRLGRKILLQRGVDITKEEQHDGIVPVVSSGGIMSFHDKSHAAGPGVVVGRKGSAGAVYYVESDFWPHDTTLWVKSFRGNHPRYVFYQLASMDLSSFDTGTANPTLNRNLVHPTPVSWPPLDEQRAIAAFLDTETTKVEALIAKVRDAIERLKELRTALISAAVTGKIDVREQATA